MKEDLEWNMVSAYHLNINLATVCPLLNADTAVEDMAGIDGWLVYPGCFVQKKIFFSFKLTGLPLAGLLILCAAASCASGSTTVTVTFPTTAVGLSASYNSVNSMTLTG